MNNSDKTIKWTFDLRNCNEALEQGNFKFLHSSGMPFLTHGEGGVEGTLEPGQTTTVNVLFCPSKFCRLILRRSIAQLWLILSNQLTSHTEKILPSFCFCFSKAR